MTLAPPLRILYAGTLPPHQGGSALMAGQLLEELARRGHEIVAISPIAEASPGGEDAMVRSGIDVRRVSVSYANNSPDIPVSEDYQRAESERTIALLEQAMAEREFDLLLVGRESFAPYVAGLGELPRILIVAGTTIAGIENGRFPLAAAEPILEAIRSFDLVVTSAPPVVQTMARLGVAGVRVIRNPVDRSIFHPGEATLRARLALGEGDIVVAHASNLKAQKRPLDIVVAAEAALERDPRLLFVIAGDGTYRQELQRESSARGLAERFRFLGWIEHRAVADLFRSSDMLVMPSWFEAQALVYLEAQACGCALIASDIPAARVVVEHRVSGMLFPLGDAAALAAAIVALGADPQLRAALVARALDQVSAHSLPAVTDEYELAFRSLIADLQA